MSLSTVDTWRNLHVLLQPHLAWLQSAQLCCATAQRKCWCVVGLGELTRRRSPDLPGCGGGTWTLEERDKFCRFFGRFELQSLQLQLHGVSPSDLLTKGTAHGPRWRLRLHADPSGIAVFAGLENDGLENDTVHCLVALPLLPPQAIPDVVVDIQGELDSDSSHSSNLRKLIAYVQWHWVG